MDSSSIRLPPLPNEQDLFSPSMKSGSRALKSISVLTLVLISKMPLNGCPDFHIRQLATELGVDIKRIYTILNVLEAVLVVQRKGKDVYEWKGSQNLTVPLIKLAQLAHRENLSHQMFKVMNGGVGLDTAEKKGRCQMSISILTQKLLMMFLVLPQPKVLSLSVAVSILYGQGIAAKSKQGCMQKLWDISKVLQVIGLIQKVEISTLDSSNPIKAYKYIGVDIEVVDNGCSEALKEIEVDVNRTKESPSPICEGDLICNVKSLPSSSGGTDGDFKCLKLKQDVGLEFLEGEKMY